MIRVMRRTRTGATMSKPAFAGQQLATDQTAAGPTPQGSQRMPEDTPVLDTLADMTAASLERSTLEPREHMIARIAALVAQDAPPASYLLNAGAAADVGLNLEDAQGVLIAVAPIVGTSRVVSAAGNIARALGFAISVLEAELEAELDAAGD
jgi:hypothetical protein